jgi:nucleoside-diphosphate-sugar epimerase
MGLPHPHLTPPLWLAWAVTWFYEKAARLRGAKEAPIFNFTRLKFLGLNLDFSIDKARRELGYNPRVSFDDAMQETMAWYRANAEGMKG